MAMPGIIDCLVTKSHLNDTDGTRPVTVALDTALVLEHLNKAKVDLSIKDWVGHSNWTRTATRGGIPPESSQTASGLVEKPCCQLSL